MLMLMFLGSRLGRRRMSWITGWIWGKGKLGEGCRGRVSRRIWKIVRGGWWLVMGDLIWSEVIRMECGVHHAGGPENAYR